MNGTECVTAVTRGHFKKPTQTAQPELIKPTHQTLSIFTVSFTNLVQSSKRGLRCLVENFQKRLCSTGWTALALLPVTDSVQGNINTLSKLQLTARRSDEACTGYHLGVSSKTKATRRKTSVAIGLETRLVKFTHRLFSNGAHFIQGLH